MRLKNFPMFLKRSRRFLKRLQARTCPFLMACVAKRKALTANRMLLTAKRSTCIANNTTLTANFPACVTGNTTSPANSTTSPANNTVFKRLRVHPSSFCQYGINMSSGVNSQAFIISMAYSSLPTSSGLVLFVPKLNFAPLCFAFLMNFSEGIR